MRLLGWALPRRPTMPHRAAPLAGGSRWSRSHYRVAVGLPVALACVWQAQPTSRTLAAGAEIAFLGVLLRAVAAGQLRKHQTLTTSGVYAITRNPLYLGTVVMAAGFALATELLGRRQLDRWLFGGLLSPRDATRRAAIAGALRRRLRRLRRPRATLLAAAWFARRDDLLLGLLSWQRRIPGPSGFLRGRCAALVETVPGRVSRPTLAATPPPLARRAADVLLVVTAASVPLSTTGEEAGLIALAALTLVAVLARWAVVRRTPLDGVLAILGATLAASTLASGHPLQATGWLGRWVVLAYFVVFWWLRD